MLLNFWWLQAAAEEEMVKVVAGKAAAAVRVDLFTNPNFRSFLGTPFPLWLEPAVVPTTTVKTANFTTSLLLEAVLGVAAPMV
jgi:hypothetical protein